MKTTKKCAFCGRMFTPNSGMQKYCTVHCADEAKKAKKKRQQDLLNAVEPVLEIQRQEYLTFSKAAILMGCSRQYIYKLVAQGRLRASRISNRMAFIRRADIEKMLEDNPYNRVIPDHVRRKPLPPVQEGRSLSPDGDRVETAWNERHPYRQGPPPCCSGGCSECVRTAAAAPSCG